MGLAPGGGPRGPQARGDADPVQGSRGQTALTDLTAACALEMQVMRYIVTQPALATRERRVARRRSASRAARYAAARARSGRRPADRIAPRSERSAPAGWRRE